MLFEDRLFDEWLDSEAKKAIDKFRNNEELSIEDKMILTLKAQTNHFAHLDIELKDDIKKLDEKIEKYQKENIKKFEKIDEKFEKIDQEFKNMHKEFRKEFNRLYSAINSQTWKMIGAIGLIAIFIKIADNLPQIIEFFKN